LVVHRYRDTILIEIVVRDFDSAAAAEMANAIAESYQANRLAVARTIHGSDKLREEMEVRSREPVEIVDRTVRTGPSCTTRAGFLCLPDELMAGLMRGALIGLPLAFVFSLLTAFGFSRK
jgi:capsular polysaccharide biosynthesis protein